MSQPGKSVVVLAAGRGVRLQRTPPKVLLRIGFKTILERHREAFLEHGFTRQTWVLGYRSEEVVAELRRTDGPFEVVLNKEYADSGSGFSLMLGLQDQSGPLIFMDGDLVYSPALFDDVDVDTDAVLFSKRDILEKEDVKVYGTEGRLSALNKTTGDDGECVGESVGLVSLRGKTVPVLQTLLKEKLEREGKVFEWEPAIEELAKRTQISLRSTFVPWMEIDFPDDVQRAERMIAQFDR